MSNDKSAAFDLYDKLGHVIDALQANALSDAIDFMDEASEVCESHLEMDRSGSAVVIAGFKYRDFRKLESALSELFYATSGSIDNIVYYLIPAAIAVLEANRKAVRAFITA